MTDIDVKGLVKEIEGVKKTVEALDGALEAEESRADQAEDKADEFEDRFLEILDDVGVVLEWAVTELGGDPAAIYGRLSSPKAVEFLQEIWSLKRT